VSFICLQTDIDQTFFSMEKKNISRKGLSLVLLIWLIACQISALPEREMSTSPAITSQSIVTPALTPISTREPTSVPTILPEAPPTLERIDNNLPEFRVIQEIEPLYVLQAGSPVALPNFSHPEAGCNWLGIAGQVFSPDDNAVMGLVILSGGLLDGKEFLKVSFSGIAPIYGPGGYEIVLADRSIESTQTVWIQLFDTAGAPVSKQIYIDTYSDCERNLILANFISTAAPEFANKFYLPIVKR
jgi:hypothetical protein